MSVPVREYLKNRRDRALGTILGNAERTFWSKLDTPEQAQFRQAVIDAVNSYHDSVLDLVKSEDGTRNDEVVKLLNELERRIRAANAAPRP